MSKIKTGNHRSVSPPTPQNNFFSFAHPLCSSYLPLVSDILTGLVSVLLATNQVAAASNLVQKTTGISVEVAEPKDPVEKEFRKIMLEDDKAHQEIDKWIRDSQAFEEKGAGSPAATLNARIEQRQKEIKKLYEDFIEKHPKHAQARVAYASFLNDTPDEEGSAKQLEKALELDPKDPAIWNNLANYYGHRSPVKKAFEYYAKAIELNPKEPVYFQNFATTVYLFRQDAMEFYNISETEVFDKALDLYRKAIQLSPNDFVLHSDYAQSFYGTKPPRYDEGLKAWEEALKVVNDDVERQGVFIHLARCKINLGKFDEAQKDLNAITNQMYLGLKEKLQKKLEKNQNNPTEAQAPTASDK